MSLLEQAIDPSRGKRGPVLLVLFVALILIVINLSNWLILSRVSASVEEELGLRLTTVASTAVTTATHELLLAPDVSEDPFVRRVLREIGVRHDLAGVFLLDVDGTTLFDLDDVGVGELNAFVDLDLVAFTNATAGISASSPSLDVDGMVLKAAYAPVEDWDGTVEAVLGVTAGAGFFSKIPALRRMLTGVSFGSAGVVVFLGAVFFGMSRRLTRTEAALSRAETLSAMGMMAAGVAHEVRNPLAIISGTATRLQRKYAPAGEEDPLFEFIPEEVERLNGILEGYLRFARDEPLTFTECDLKVVVERTTGLVEAELGGGDLKFAREYGVQSVQVLADPQRLQQVVLNLLLNAAQAMGNRGTITVELTATSTAARVVVSDTGPGFAEKELKGAFQPFYTTKESGSGLGLVMTKRIVEGHGGTIVIANRSEGGAAVTVELRVQNAEREKPEGN